MEGRHGDKVEAGQVVLRLEDARLVTDAAKLRSQLEGLNADLFLAMQRDPVKARDVEADIGRVTAQLKRVEELQEALVLRAGVAGQLTMPRQVDVDGAFVPRGALLGHVFTGEPATVRVAVEQDVAALVRSDTRQVGVRLAESAGETLPARLLRAVPAATEKLPSPALGDFAGGRFAVDPADEDHQRTPSPVFVFDLVVDGLIPERAGGRVWVRFDHGWAPLAVQWARQLKQLFLSNFNPAT
jgi:putative peptide zinc metalloprotease protein